MFLPVPLSKSKFFTRVALVSFMSHSYHTCVAPVLLVSHSYRTRVASVTFVLHSCRSCLALVLYIRLDHIYNSIKETNWLISKGTCGLLFYIFNGCLTKECLTFTDEKN